MSAQFTFFTGSEWRVALNFTGAGFRLWRHYDVIVTRRWVGGGVLPSIAHHHPPAVALRACNIPTMGAIELTVRGGLAGGELAEYCAATQLSIKVVVVCFLG